MYVSVFVYIVVLEFYLIILISGSSRTPNSLYTRSRTRSIVKHIRACCSAAIDDEPRMLRADFRPADSCAFEPRLFYQRTCEMPLGPFKSASCGRILKRLLFFAAHIEFLHSAPKLPHPHQQQVQTPLPQQQGSERRKQSFCTQDRPHERFFLQCVRIQQR